MWEDVLTALNGVGCRLQGHCSPCGLVDVNSENHPHSCVLAPDVSLPLPQLNVRITQLQDSSAVDPMFVQTRDEEFAKVCLPKSFCPRGKSYLHLIRLWFIHAALQPNQKWFSLWAPSTQPWRRRQSCRQKINTGTPTELLHLNAQTLTAQTNDWERSL